MRNFILLMSTLALAACASTSGSGQSPRSRGGTDCVFQSRITGFDARSDSRLIIYTGRQREAWVAEVSAGCFDLSHQVSLSLIDGDANGSICGFGRDSVAFSSMGGRMQSCRILSLQRVEDAAREVMEGEPGAKDKPDQEPTDEE